jgi:hypothetical protein
MLALAGLSAGGFLASVTLREPDGVWAREGAILGLAFGLLFGYAALRGVSPRWLEEGIGGRAPAPPPDVVAAPASAEPPSDVRAS